MYHKIKNPETGKNVSIYGKTGQHILRKYLNIFQQNGGFIRGGVRIPSDNYLDTTTSCNSQVAGGDIFGNTKKIVNKIHLSTQNITGSKKKECVKKDRKYAMEPYKTMLTQYLTNHKHSIEQYDLTVDSVLDSWLDCSGGISGTKSSCDPEKFATLNEVLTKRVEEVDSAESDDKIQALNMVVNGIMDGGYTKLPGTDSDGKLDQKIKCILGLATS